MLTFNTFSEREREKKKYRHYLIILLSIILSILCYGIYHNAQVELTLLEKQITLLTQKLSKNTSPTVTHLMQLQKICKSYSFTPQIFPTRYRCNVYVF